MERVTVSRLLTFLVVPRHDDGNWTFAMRQMKNCEQNEEDACNVQCTLCMMSACFCMHMRDDFVCLTLREVCVRLQNF